jgi:flavin reductase
LTDDRDPGAPRRDPVVDAEKFRRVMASFATGVTVMTSTTDGVPHGMTANAVSSVSLDPVLVLVCVERGTVMADTVEQAGCFALSILAADAVTRSEHFAAPDRPLGAAQFAAVETTTASTGALVLADALAWLDCRLWATYDGGDHLIVVGEVVALGQRPGQPLVYFRSRYTTVEADRADT